MRAPQSTPRRRAGRGASSSSRSAPTLVLTLVLTRVLGECNDGQGRAWAALLTPSRLVSCGAAVATFLARLLNHIVLEHAQEFGEETTTAGY